ncbi:hypothetical protein [Kitasatospora sp. NPDC002040]|uniref:hypothetical protein n=1 Tax=Kitasatospora sp. NPDC002040 TaxID=3154661 RepID=UPI00331A637A
MSEVLYCRAADLRASGTAAVYWLGCHHIALLARVLEDGAVPDRIEEESHV